MLAMAAVDRSPAWITDWAARAVLAAWTASKLCRRMKPAHCDSACGWLTTRRISPSVAPGTPSKCCVTGRAYMPVTYRVPLNMRSVTWSTSPAQLFSTGSTHTSQAPRSTAS